LKLSIILATLITAFTSITVFAECNTVMGGCVKEDAVNASPHMHSDYTPPKTQAQKAAEKADKSKQSLTADSKTKASNKKL
jgi:hypothetical protein